MECFDVCVVGAGMTGSAAAKWLSVERGTKACRVCLVGPAEPTEEEWAAGSDRKVFGAHYDESRITRESDEDLIWGLLAQRSIQEYRSIEQESGIRFYNEVGLVTVCDESSDEMKNTLRVANRLGVEHEIRGRDDLRDMFPYLRTDPENRTYLWTPRNAGYISARNLVAAQQRIVETNGCALVNDVVVKVTEVEVTSSGELGRHLGTEGSIMKVVTSGNREILARRVLLCPGAFANFYHLLPEGLVVDTRLSKYVMVSAEVTEVDARKMFAAPSILFAKGGVILPPVKYPDGKYYLKVGSWIKDEYVNDIDDCAQWFNQRHGRHDAQFDEAVMMMRKRLPGLKPVSLKVINPCILTLTPTGRPYCDMVHPRLGILVGMNGFGAKSSNELGRMGARMIAKGRWDYDLPAELFKLRCINGPVRKSKL